MPVMTERAIEGILGEIVRRTRLTVAESEVLRPVETVREVALASAPTRGFVQSVTALGVRFAVIAEIKRQSPSAGFIRPEYSDESFEPESIARRYHRAGASSISCLTNGPYFAGKLSYLPRVRGACPLPVLRKDFIVDPYQVYEARAAGADAVLLIAECLDDRALVDLHGLAQSLTLDVLLEVHDADQVRRVAGLWGGSRWPAGTLLGVNNRDLRTMKVDLGTCERAVEMFGRPEIMVAESGIKTFSDLIRLREFGIRIALVGEHLMRDPDPGRALSTMLNGFGSAV